MNWSWIEGNVRVDGWGGIIYIVGDGVSGSVWEKQASGPLSLPPTSALPS